MCAHINASEAGKCLGTLILLLPVGLKPITYFPITSSLILINGRKSMRFFLSFLFNLYLNMCKIYITWAVVFYPAWCALFTTKFVYCVRGGPRKLFLPCCEQISFFCFSPPPPHFLCRPVIEGQNNSTTVAINSAQSLPASIVVSLPPAAPVRPNNTLSNRKAGTLPANLEEMKVMTPGGFVSSK